MTVVTGRKISPRLPNRRGEGPRLRCDIVRAATCLLEESGDEDAVTLRAVARAVGIAAPSIYAHFSDPATIVGAVVAETFTALIAALRAAREGIEDPVERLSAQCYGYLRFARQHPGLYRVLFARARRFEPPAGRLTAELEAEVNTTAKDAMIVEAGTPAIMLLVDAIAACAAAGRSTSQDPWLDAVALWAMLHGY
ncbi:MAG: TetR/AcrR family transcriptional regulator, partial [Chloroflexota bacterium]|nr:TetR/AcrR family transcriptional regulator [Chloroflexota bacterium]